MDVFQNILTVFIVISASLAALAGLWVLGSFFHNKLKELFNDVNYFIFFFLIIGYFMYSIGEISYYLATETLGDTSALGIADVYWTGGAIFILVSFIALTITLFKQNYDRTKLIKLLLFGGLLLTVVSYVVLGVTLRDKAHFFGYFYPFVGVAIVTFAFSVILFSPQLEHFGTALFLFFLASCSILLGDMFFTYVTTRGFYGLMSIIGDTFYLLGYSLSFIAFVVLRLKMRNLSF